jgi:hypothetical protein
LRLNFTVDQWPQEVVIAAGKRQSQFRHSHSFKDCSKFKVQRSITAGLVLPSLLHKNYLPDLLESVIPECR